MPLLWLLILLSFGLSFSIEVFSERLERLSDGTLRAYGNVEVFYQNYYIKADFAEYNPNSKKVYAKGDVYVKSKDGRLETTGEEAFIDLEQDTGYFIKADGRFERFYFRAERVDKEGDVYYVEEGTITTCPPERNEMFLCFSRARISNRYVVSQNNSLRLFNVPIAYLPLGVFPVGERRSGLLPPLIGSNVYNTFIYQQPIYWAISKDKDATLTIDYRDKQAKGLQLEYRQALNKPIDIYGLIAVYKEPSPPGKWWEGRNPQTFRENRYRLKLDLELGNLRAGVDTLSDPYFMQDIYLSTKERTVPFLTSYLTYKKEWERFLFTVDIKRFYDTTSDNNKSTLQRLPEIGFYLKDTPLFGFAYLSLASSYTNFYREEGLKSQRLFLSPGLTLQKNLFGRTFLSELRVDTLLYFDTKGGSYKDKSVFSPYFSERVPFFFDRELFGFKLSNVFELSYSYRSKTYNNPRFDNLDEINKTNQLDFILRSYGSYKGKPLFNLSITGAYNLLGTYYYNSTPVKSNFMPIRSLISVYTLEGVVLSSDTLYDAQRSNLLRSVSSATFSYLNTSLSVGQVMERNAQGEKTNDQFNFSLSTNYKDLKLSYSLVRDLRINKDLQKSLSFEYRGACWSFGTLFRSIYDGTRGKYINEVFLAFNVFDLQRFTVPLKR